MRAVSLGVVSLLVLPHRQHRRCKPASDRELGQVRSHAAVDQALVVLVEWVVRHLRGHQVRGALEDLLQRVSSGWALRPA